MTSATATDQRARNAVLLGLVAGYAALYLCRVNLPAAKGALVGIGIDNQAFGRVVSLGTLAYAAGKLASGPLTERLGPRFAFFAAIFGSALAIAVLSQLGAGGFGVFAGLWMLSRAVQAVGWAGLVAIVPRWVPPGRYGTVMGWMSLSYQLGGVLAPLLLAWLIDRQMGWDGLFLYPALLLAAIGAALLPVVRASPAHPQPSAHALADAPQAADVQPQPSEVVAAESLAKKRSGTSILLANRRFWLVLALSFVLTLLRECFSTWLPAYFSSLGDASAAAVYKSTLFPLLGCVGTIAAGWISDRMSPGNRGPILVILLSGLVAVLAGLAWAEPLAGLLGLAGKDVAVALTALAGLFVLAPYSMVGGGVIALDFGGKDASAAAAGLLDAVGYLGASLAGVGVAETVSHLGWTAAWQGLAGLSALAVVLCLPMLRHKSQPPPA